MKKFVKFEFSIYDKNLKKHKKIKCFMWTVLPDTFVTPQYPLYSRGYASAIT